MDWPSLTLFLLITGRMTGCIVFNPLLGRRGIPGIVKAGFVLLLSLCVFPMSSLQTEIPDTLIGLSLTFLLELFLGYVLGLVMNIFFYIPLLGGETIDTQMGMSMGKTYDPGSQSSVSVTASMFNILMILLFFTANGHHTLMRIILVSGRVVPFGSVVLGQELYSAVLELFIECTIMAIKLCMPILAAELLGQVGMGILMKVIPQINVFAINIELKVIIGLGLLLVLLMPISEYMMRAETYMLQSLQRVLRLMAG